MSISPLAPAGFPVMGSIGGLQLSSVAAGIKYQGRDDVMLAVFDSHTRVAGVFTRSMTAGAPVLVSRRHLQAGLPPRALIVNSGNSNAFTGRKGEQAALETCQSVANALNCKAEQVYIASTGVIGELIPKQRIFDVIPELVEKLDANCWEQSAKAIMTTDTFAKGATIKTQIGGESITINGFAKGSGMIAPDMATMLAFVYTDAAIPDSVLQALLVEANEHSFNAITVDSDTSTSDTCLLFATGHAGNEEPRDIDDESLKPFRISLAELMKDLAVQIVRDGEGASKLIEVSVTGAVDDHAAKVVAKSIADSPLVKTAIAGEDANWGRVVMAVGKSGQVADRDELKIRMGGVLITEYGEVVADYDETPVANHLKGQEVTIETDLGVGNGSATVWTCDLTHGYIQINADYRSDNRLYVVVGVILNPSGELLIQQRPEGKPCAGHWEFPGGKLEVNETPAEALSRELKEELGITIGQFQPLMQFGFDYSHANVWLDVFVVTAFEGQEISAEGQAFLWLAIDDIKKLDLLDAVHPILSELDKEGIR